MMKRIVLAEAFGTAILVFLGCGAIAVDSLTDGALGHIGICLSFGLVVMAMIYSIGNISGAHMNPAVTIGFYFARRLDRAKVIYYIVGQTLGAVAASLALRLVFPQAAIVGVTVPAAWATPVQALVVEVILTFILMFVILNVSTGHMEKGIMAGVAVGGLIALEALVGGPVSGASMNPARSFGPALASGEWTHLWIYIVGPFLGAILAHPTCRLIQGTECCTVREGSDPD